MRDVRFWLRRLLSCLPRSRYLWLPMERWEVCLRHLSPTSLSVLRAVLCAMIILHHGPVKLAQRIRQDLPKGDFIQVFENRHRKAAYKSILRLLDSNHDGILSNQEKSRARIILFGHSWGASAVVLLSRELDRAGIPVLLTVQVDSVEKPWQRDKIIPDNVAEAVNFYQPHGLVHGRSLIMAARIRRRRFLATTVSITRKIRCHAQELRGCNGCSLPATCRANAIPVCGRKSKAWCGNRWRHRRRQPSQCRSQPITTMSGRA